MSVTRHRARHVLPPRYGQLWSPRMAVDEETRQREKQKAEAEETQRRRITNDRPGEAPFPARAPRTCSGGLHPLFPPRHGAHRPKAIGASHSPGHSDWSRGEHVTKVGPPMLHDFTLPHPRRREHPLLQYLLSLTNRSYDF